VTDIQ